MAPYALLPRDDPTPTADADASTSATSGTSPTTETSPSASASSSAASKVKSFIEVHGKVIWIVVAIVGILLLLLLFWLYKKNRLSFPPFNQKRCSTCGKGITKHDVLDKDYYKNDAPDKGWTCRRCQDEKEGRALKKEKAEADDDGYDDVDIKDEVDIESSQKDRGDKRTEDSRRKHRDAGVRSVDNNKISSLDKPASRSGRRVADLQPSTRRRENDEDGYADESKTKDSFRTNDHRRYEEEDEDSE
ncbi:hypothetical protein IAR55_003786 [Kwoniella newhampshirensis]|uniref:Uncharacterized protein n=1 Tax=Kwoniella newhampshirensis TaxID=1651941 RepID=A0AAW0YXQ2_9TREE